MKKAKAQNKDISLRNKKRLLSGTNSALAVIFVWSTWLVVSRSGVQSTLSIYDLAAVRYGISSIIALPFILYFRPWKTLKPIKIIVLSVLLGPLYALCVFGGFVFAPVAHGGIFLNGSLPAITAIMGLLIFRNGLKFLQVAGLILIFNGSIFAFMDVGGAVHKFAWRGDILFLCSAIFFSGYLLAASRWRPSLIEVLFCSSITNCIFYLPIWFLFAPKGFDGVSDAQLVLQICYQGVVPNVIGLLLIANAAKNIGPSATAAFLAAVPSISSLLGVIFLDEVLGSFGWLSIFLVTPGILMVTMGDKNGLHK